MRRENLGVGADGDPNPAGTSSAGECRGPRPAPPSPPRRRSRPAPSPRNTSPNRRPRGVGGCNGAWARERGAGFLWGRRRGYSAPYQGGPANRTEGGPLLGSGQRTTRAMQINNTNKTKDSTLRNESCGHAVKREFGG